MSFVGPTETIRVSNADNSWDSGIFKRRVRIKWLHIEYTSSATVGNRQLHIDVNDAAGNTVLDIHAGAVQAASLAYHYSCLPGIFRETAFVDSSIQVPIPIDFIVDGNHKIVVEDNANIDVADTLVVSYQTEEV